MFKNIEYALMLKYEDSFDNVLMRHGGMLFLNEALEILGWNNAIPNSQIGWVYDPQKDDQTDILDVGQVVI